MALAAKDLHVIGVVAAAVAQRYDVVDLQGVRGAAGAMRRQCEYIRARYATSGALALGARIQAAGFPRRAPGWRLLVRTRARAVGGVVPVVRTAVNLAPR